jgi:hypothetical protein
MSAIQNEQIQSDLHKIGGWGSVLSSKHPCTPFKNFKTKIFPICFPILFLEFISGRNPGIINSDVHELIYNISVVYSCEEVLVIHVCTSTS